MRLGRQGKLVSRSECICEGIFGTGVKKGKKMINDMSKDNWVNLFLFMLVGVFIGVLLGKPVGAYRQRELDGACMPGLYHGKLNGKILCIGGRGEIWEVQKD